MFIRDLDTWSVGSLYDKAVRSLEEAPALRFVIGITLMMSVEHKHFLKYGKTFLKFIQNENLHRLKGVHHSQVQKWFKVIYTHVFSQSSSKGLIVYKYVFS